MKEKKNETSAVGKAIVSSRLGAVQFMAILTHWNQLLKYSLISCSAL
jgi:hypothetical protein